MFAFDMGNGGSFVFGEVGDPMITGNQRATDYFFGTDGVDTFNMGYHGGQDYIFDFQDGDHLRLLSPPWGINWTDTTDGTLVTYWGNQDSVMLYGYHGDLNPGNWHDIFVY